MTIQIDLTPPLLTTVENMRWHAETAPAGAFVEIGVYQGRSAQRLYDVAQTQGRDLYLYDTFCGMPYQGPLDGNPVGSWADTSAQAVQKLMPSAHVIEGLFPESLVKMPPVAFVHADADQYESTAQICRFMPGLMVKGGMILFDDYGVGDCQGCTAAVQEYFKEFEILDTGRALVVIGG